MRSFNSRLKRKRVKERRERGEMERPRKSKSGRKSALDKRH